MGIRFYTEPELEKPDLIASWPGIGNIGVITVNTLRDQLKADLLGEIEPWDFFYPKRVIIKSGVLQNLEFPGSRFYYKKTENKDLLFFIGEEQPTDMGRMYAEGKKAYQMANLVLDVAERFNCHRIYTSGAAVTLTHHALKPRVWAVTVNEELIKEIRGYTNTMLMGEGEGIGELGNITGLNGLLLGLAKKRGFDAMCLMGEIPDYLSGVPFPYPKASKSILEVLTSLLKVEIDYHTLDDMEVQINGIVAGIYEKLPPEVRDRIEQRESIVQSKPEAITEEDKKWIEDHIDELFKKGDEEDGSPS